VKIIAVRNVHDALPEAIRYLTLYGYRRSSRNGAVLVLDSPVTTVYERPTERVLFWEQRDANPFFHLFEALWMMAGKRDVAYPARFAARMLDYSDDGKTLLGAYGWRWRSAFGFDQLRVVVERLRADHDDRRAVLTMWDPISDLHSPDVETKDLPCNTHVYFAINKAGSLDMTVCCRSNDIIWGAYGANAVHMSVLQEYVARCLDRAVGRYWQVSNNWHAYEAVLLPMATLGEKAREIGSPIEPWNPYASNEVIARPMVGADTASWLEQVAAFVEGADESELSNGFLADVACPMRAAWALRKSGDHLAAYRMIADHPICMRSDWGTAALQWIYRRSGNVVGA
jgi:thymidylate synthase